MYENYDRIVRELLKYSNPGPTVDAVNRRSLRTALMIAAQKDRYRIAQLLVQANPKPQHLDRQNRSNSETALVTAARNNNWNTVGVIIGYNPAIDLRNADRDGALHFAIKDKQTSLVRRMLDGRGGNAAAKQKNSEGYTPLHLAAMSGIGIIAQEILDAGAKKTDKDVWGHTAIDLANANGDYAMASLITNY